MTLTDRASKTKELPWEETKDSTLKAFCRIDEDLLLNINLKSFIDVEDYEFEMYQGEPPMPSERFQVETRGNVVQLTLRHASREDAGHYALVAKKLPRDNESERLFSRRIYMSVDDPSFTEEGDPPFFLRRLTDLTVKVGTRTRFLVEIRSATDPKVTWHRNDISIQEEPRLSFVQEGNFYCVDVAPVTVDDQGHWTCMAENRSGRSSCTSHLNVLVPKAYKRPEFISQLRALLTETGTVSLECKVIGVPTPVLKWFKDEKEIKAGDIFALTANPDDPTSLGTYTCEAVNCMGTTYSSSRVHVVGKGSREGSLKPADTLVITGDPPIFKKILRDKSCKIGESILLSCQVQVPPWPKEITWYNKEGCVEENDRYKIIEDGLGGYSIRVNPTEAVDEGEWKCVATNEDNAKQFTTCFITMSFPKNYRTPRFMESLKAVLTEEGLVSFECKVVGFPTPLLRWFKDGQELKPGDVYQLTGTNSLGSYCCIAKNCMGEAKSTAELTVEDIQNQLNEEERLQLLTINQPPKFIKGLRSSEARISDNFKFSVQVSIMPEPSIAWYRDDHPVNNENRYHIEQETLGISHLEVQRLEFCDQAEWKCVASNDFGHSITSCFLKLIIPKHYKKPKFLENLRAILSDGGAVNLECKVIGVPQPILKWYKDGDELKPGDIHKIISGQDGTCCLGTYTCEAINCMGTVSSSASLLGFEDRVTSAQSFNSSIPIISQIEHERELARNISLSTIHEERTSQLLDTVQTDHSVTLDDRGEVSFSFDGKEVSVSLYETPDLTEEEALQVLEMYADQLSENITEHNVVELPPMRFVKETSTSGNLLMEAVVIDVPPDYFAATEGDDLCTEADLEDISMIDGISISSPPLTEFVDENNLPMRPPRKKSGSTVLKIQDPQESETYHSAKEPLTTSHKKKDNFDIEMDIDSEAFTDALSSIGTKTDSFAVNNKNQKRSLHDDFSFDNTDISLDSVSGTSSQKTNINNQFKKKQKLELEEPENIEESLKNVKIEQEQILTDVLPSPDKDKQHIMKVNKEKLVDLLRKILEPVLILREALIDSNHDMENDNFINELIADKIVVSIQKLCEIITDIETKALKYSDEKSLDQNIRIAILENLGGPTEELLRGLELIGRQENEYNIQFNLSILESLVDPVDEIIFGLAKLEYELSGRNITETPVVLERTKRIANRLELTFQQGQNNMENPKITSLQKVYEILNEYLNSIELNQFGGWAENIDAVLVESLSRLLEDLEHSSKYLLQRIFPEIITDNIMKISNVFNEILSRLDALVVALEGYETDCRMNFVINLKTSIVAAAEEISKYKNEELDDFKNLCNLPEAILDALVDVQTTLNSVLLEAKKTGSEEDGEHCRTPEIVLNLAELREAVSFAVHKTTTLKEDEIIEAIISLNEPLINLKLSLTGDSILEEISGIKNIIFPLDSLQKIMNTVTQYAQTPELKTECLNKIKPIYSTIEELKQKIFKSSKNIYYKKIDKEIFTNTNTQLEMPIITEQILANNLKISSELSTIHYEFGLILEKYAEFVNIQEPILSTILELRQIIGNAAIELDNISNKINLNEFVEKLFNLKEPLLKLQNSVLNSEVNLLQEVITVLLEPLQRLKINLITFDQQVISTPNINLLLHIIDDIIKDIIYYININDSKAIQIENNKLCKYFFNTPLESEYLSEESKFFEETQSYKTSNLPLIKEVHRNMNESSGDMSAFADISKTDIESPDPIQRRLDMITDKYVIYPKQEFAAVISQSLDGIQQQVSDILEEFEIQSVTSLHPVSRLAEALENLRRTILTVRSNVSQIAFEVSNINSESSRTESRESTERISLSLKELLHPILEIREALVQTQNHRAPDLLLLNRLDQPIRAIEFNVLQLALQAHSHTLESDGTSSRMSLDTMARALEDIESQIPVALGEVNSRQEVLSILQNVSKPLEVIRERMHEISSDNLQEDNLDLDIVNALNEPIDKFRDALNELFYQVDTIDHDDNDREAPLILKFLIEPLVELQSSLSVVRSSRKASLVEAAILDDRKNVILRAVEEVKCGIDKISNEIDKIQDITPLQKLIVSSVNALKSGMIVVQNQVSEANYTHPRSCLRTLHSRTNVPLQQLGEKITLLKEKMDKTTLKLIIDPLETLSKQVQLAQIQFLESSEQPLDEEVIIEGFLYPVKRLLLSLESMKQIANYTISENDQNLLQELERSISIFGSALLALQNELIQEGADEKASIVETLTAVLMPLNNVTNLIQELSKTVVNKETFIKEDNNIKQHDSSKNEIKVNDDFPTVLTTVDTFVDEFIEVSKRETESLTTLKYATIETIEEDQNELLNFTNEFISRVAANEIDIDFAKYIEVIPLEKLMEFSTANINYSDNLLHEKLEKYPINNLEFTSNFLTERRNSITVLWSLIKEPLYNLQESISSIIESPLVDDIIKGNENKFQSDIIERLTNLKKSISAMQQITNEDSEEITITSWEQNSLPALQNLALSLELLGEYLPVMTENDDVLQHKVNVDEIVGSSTIASALKTLITPLQKLKECLSLIIEEQLSYNTMFAGTEDNLQENKIKISEIRDEITDFDNVKNCDKYNLNESINNTLQPEKQTSHTNIPKESYELVSYKILDETLKEIENSTLSDPKSDFNKIFSEQSVKQCEPNKQLMPTKCTATLKNSINEQKDINEYKDKNFVKATTNEVVIQNSNSSTNLEFGKENNILMIHTSETIENKTNQYVEQLEKQENEIGKENEGMLENKNLEQLKNEQVDNLKKENLSYQLEKINTENLEKEKEEKLENSNADNLNQAKAEQLKKEKEIAGQLEEMKTINIQKGQAEKLEEENTRKLEKEKNEKMEKVKKNLMNAEKLKNKIAELLENETVEAEILEKKERLENENTKVKTQKIEIANVEKLEKVNEEQLESDMVQKLEKEREEKLEIKNADNLKQVEQLEKEKENKKKLDKVKGMTIEKEKGEELGKENTEKLENKKILKSENENARKSIKENGGKEKLDKDNEEKLDTKKNENLEYQIKEILENEKVVKLERQKTENLGKENAEQMEKEKAKKLKIEEAAELKKEETKKLEKNISDVLENEHLKMEIEDAEELKKEETEKLNEKKADLLENKKAKEIEINNVEELRKEKSENLDGKNAGQLKKDNAQETEKETVEELKKKGTEKIEKENVEQIDIKNEKEIENVEILKRDKIKKLKTENEEKVEKEEVKERGIEITEKLKKEKSEKVEKENAEQSEKEKAEEKEIKNAEEFKKQEIQELENENAQQVRTKMMKENEKEKPEEMKKELEKEILGQRDNDPKAEENENAEELEKQKIESLEQEKEEQLKDNKEKKAESDETDKQRKEELENLQGNNPRQLKKDNARETEKETLKQLIEAKTEEKENLEQQDKKKTKKMEIEMLKELKEDSENIEKENSAQTVMEKEKEKEIEKTEELQKQKKELLEDEKAGQQMKEIEKIRKIENVEKLKKEEKKKLERENVEQLKKENLMGKEIENVKELRKEETNVLVEEKADRQKEEIAKITEIEYLEELKKEETEKLEIENAEQLKKENLVTKEIENAEELEEKEKELLEKEKEDQQEKEMTKLTKIENVDKLKKEEMEKLQKKNTEKVKKENEKEKEIENTEKSKKEEAAILRNEKPNQQQNEMTKISEIENVEELKKEATEKLEIENAEQLKKENLMEKEIENAEELEEQEKELLEKEKADQQDKQVTKITEIEYGDKRKKEATKKLDNENAELKKANMKEKEIKSANELKKEETKVLEKVKAGHQKEEIVNITEIEYVEELKKEATEQLELENAEQLKKENLMKKEIENDDKLKTVEMEQLQKENTELKKENMKENEIENAKELIKEKIEILENEKAGQQKEEIVNITEIQNVEKLKKEATDKLEKENAEKLKKDNLMEKEIGNEEESKIEEADVLVEEKADRQKEEIAKITEIEYVKELKKEATEKLENVNAEQLKKENLMKKEFENAEELFKEEIEILENEKARISEIENAMEEIARITEIENAMELKKEVTGKLEKENAEQVKKENLKEKEIENAEIFEKNLSNKIIENNIDDFVSHHVYNETRGTKIVEISCSDIVNLQNGNDKRDSIQIERISVDVDNSVNLNKRNSIKDDDNIVFSKRFNHNRVTDSFKSTDQSYTFDNINVSVNKFSSNPKKQYSDRKSKSLQNIDKAIGNDIQYGFDNSISCRDVFPLKRNSMQNNNQLYPNEDKKYLSTSRDDLLYRERNVRLSSPYLYSGTNIHYSNKTILHAADNKRKNKFSMSLLNLEPEPMSTMHARSLGSIRKYFEYPTYTSKSINSNKYSMSVSDFLVLNRSRSRFKSRNPFTTYEEPKSFTRNKILYHGKCPSFCTRLTNCTIAEGSHMRLICTVIGEPEPQVYWTKNGDRVRPGGHEQTKYENGMATLEIATAALENSGYYACLARNLYGQSSTEATVRVYPIYDASLLNSSYISMKNDRYNLIDRESRIRNQLISSVTYEKDNGIFQGNRYRSSFLDDGIFRLQTSESDISNKTYRPAVYFNEHENTNNRLKTDGLTIHNQPHKFGKEHNIKLPRISNCIADYKVPAGGTIALQVEIKDKTMPDVKWLCRKGERQEPVSSPKVRTFAESGVYTLIVPQATESEGGTYICRVSNDYGHIDTSTKVEVIPSNKFDDLGKPAAFVSQPTDKIINALEGEAISVSFRVSGIPRPKVIWMKGIKDISEGPRSHKEIIDDYIRLTLNRVHSDDQGTYCILVKNCYGCDRSFFTLKVRQRARSLTPTSGRSYLSDRLSDIHIREQQSYSRNIPGAISSEPIVIDGGRNWLSLSWEKADPRGPAPVIAYRVDAWQIGGDGGARWKELGITPINSFDAFNLRPGGEYKFRVTPKNRYGWGESVTMSTSATVCDDLEIPEFTKILPGQLKALEDSTVELECEVRSDSKFDVKWLRESVRIDSHANSKYTIKNDRYKCSLALKNITEDDSGRYICEVTNKAGKVSSYGRILVVKDPKILSADERLKKRFLDGVVEDGPPQFTMRLRDRRVQVSYPVRLTCQVFGCPEPEIFWLKDGEIVTESPTRSIQMDDSHFYTLEIAMAKLEDCGSYTVCAKNENGSVSCHCLLIVDKGIRAYIAPQFLYDLDVAYAVKVGGDLRLRTHIEAYPSVGVAWHRDGLRLRPRRSAVMTLSHDGIAELILMKVRYRDAGIYTCTAMNEVGKAETSTKVCVTEPGDSLNVANDDHSLQVFVNPPAIDTLYSKVPLFVTKPLSTEAQEGDTVIIQCEVVGDPKPEVIWLRDFLKPDYYRDASHFRRIGAGPQYRLEIPDAKLDYTGTYSVLAKNENGECKALISLQIYAKGQGRSDSMNHMNIKQGEVLSVPTIQKDLKDIRCCDGDTVTLECKVYAPSEHPIIRWEKSGKPLPIGGDFLSEFDGENAKLIIHHVYPEDEGEYTCVASNELGKAFTSACLVVDVPEGKENMISQPLLSRPQSLLSTNSTPRSTPVRSLSPATSHGRELKALNLPRRIDLEYSFRRKLKICPPKFYSIPHNRVAEEGETVRFQCAVAGHPMPWYFWDKDGVNITSSMRVSFKEKDDVRILEISNVTLQDAGLYRVTLENDVGRTEATARLEIISNLAHKTNHLRCQR